MAPCKGLKKIIATVERAAAKSCSFGTYCHSLNLASVQLIYTMFHVISTYFCRHVLNQISRYMLEALEVSGIVFFSEAR